MRPINPPTPSRHRLSSVSSHSPGSDSSKSRASSVSSVRSTTGSTTSTARAKTNRIISILVFNNVEILDFTVPYEIYHLAKQQTLSEHRITIQLLAIHSIDEGSQSIQSDNPLKVFAFGGLKLIADAMYNDINHCDVLVIPGGIGVKGLLNHSEFLAWLHHIVPSAELVHTISAGSLLLAAAGLLDSGRTYCTHHSMVDQMAELQPNIIVNPDRSVRYTHQKSIITSGGSSAGIDSSLYIVSQLYGEHVYKAVVDSMSYITSPQGESTAMNAKFQNRVNNPTTDNR